MDYTKLSTCKKFINTANLQPTAIRDVKTFMPSKNWHHQSCHWNDSVLLRLQNTAISFLKAYPGVEGLSAQSCADNVVMKGKDLCSLQSSGLGADYCATAKSRGQSERGPHILRAPVSFDWWTIDDWPGGITRQDGTQAVRSASHSNEYSGDSITFILCQDTERL